MERKHSILIEQDEIIANFTQDNPCEQIYVIMGENTTNNTAYMIDTVNKLRADKSWICVELNPGSDLLTNLTSKLASIDGFSFIYQETNINLSFFGLGVDIKDTVPIVDSETAISQMLGCLKKHGKKVLVTINEVSNTKYMREFISSFQIFIRQDLPLFLLMSGSHKGVYELQNVNTLTFLYRAPKIKLSPLNTTEKD